jgi:hypothetical protein
MQPCKPAVQHATASAGGASRCTESKLAHVVEHTPVGGQWLYSGLARRGPTCRASGTSNPASSPSMLCRDGTMMSDAALASLTSRVGTVWSAEKTRGGKQYYTLGSNPPLRLGNSMSSLRTDHALRRGTASKMAMPAEMLTVVNWVFHNVREVEAHIKPVQPVGVHIHHLKITARC